MASRKKFWYVADRDCERHGKMVTVGGPYRHAETAGAVRDEMERNPREKRNLWVVWEFAAA